MFTAVAVAGVAVVIWQWVSIVGRGSAVILIGGKLGIGCNVAVAQWQWQWQWQSDPLYLLLLLLSYYYY
jgi:hypothetical protein